MSAGETHLNKAGLGGAGSGAVPGSALPGIQGTMGGAAGGLMTMAGAGKAASMKADLLGRWAMLTPSQRQWAMIGAALVVSVLAGLGWYASRPDWKTLYAGLDPEDARQMSQVLTQAQITYDLAANGSSIRVPAPQLDKARLATAAKGGPKSGRLGFELFDKPNWVGSEFDEQVNYQRALEGELEHTVATLSDVQSARVHLVMPHESLFREQERPAKASVVLTLRHHTLADGEDEAIRNLVASAVDGLSPAQVSLTDASGRMPLGPKSADATRLATEQALEAKVIETLEPVTGPGNVRASVTVEYDPTATDTTEEIYDPNKTVTLSMQRTEQASGSQPVAAGVPGTATNAPNSQEKPVYPQQVTSPQNAKTESGTYGASKTVRHTVQGPGHIRRITAAVVVNDRIAAAAAAQKLKTITWQPRSADELKNLTSLAQAAIGFDTTRGDVVTVQDFAFDQNRSAQPPSAVNQLLSTVERSPLLIKYGAILLGLVLVIFLAIRPSLARARLPEKAAAGGKPTAELGAAEAQAALPVGAAAELDVEKLRVQQVFNQVSETLKRDPAQSSRLLQSWIHSE